MENAEKPQNFNTSSSVAASQTTQGEAERAGGQLADAASRLCIYNTATHSVAPFEPIKPGQVGIYVCGATVQSSPHIGHIRAAVAFDIVRRWFERLGYKVTFIRNVTDIDDKILDKATAAGQQWWARAYHYEREFAKAYDTLGVEAPTYEPRATGHIDEMVELIGRIIDNGHAYVIRDEKGNPTGNVFFDVASWPHYGELTHQKQSTTDAASDAASQITDRMGPSVDATGDDKYNPVDPADYDPAKHDPRDFALWKASKPSDPATARWQTPYGTGRPGWHIECSAMSHRYLDGMFDIHGGGLDLRFPHHENEMAQTRAAGYQSARVWMHSAWVTAKGEKMSKSLGNGLSVPSVLAHNPAWVVRYALGAVQYRSMLEWSDQSLAEARAAYERITGFIERAGETLNAGMNTADGANTAAPETKGSGRNSASGGQPSRSEVTSLSADQLPGDFVAAMNDDFNISGAIAAIFTSIRHGNSMIQAIAQHQSPIAQVDPAAVAALANEFRSTIETIAERYPDLSQDIIWADAKARFALKHTDLPSSFVDDLGSRLELRRVLLTVRAMLDTLGLDPLAEPWVAGAGDGGFSGSTTGSVGGSGSNAASEHELLDTIIRHQLNAREAARKARNFEVADKIRDSLANMGVEITDTPTGATWKLR
ncbi:cysteinyl-tRNA synthetase [Bifidobacterium bohemicum]|uniref:Cysteine--tRNA ligase n=1 Tax=Bifidobacterium bohemicum DSM 22767 TaxID=1437606 RepID=A0A086ZEX7_9BIFI|nr:cysteine--tRNA ligase [Bifidobacterium bohemicum]KFI45077.1 cysteinyl-tRNA synthetase [Bifidobacterium bohemicum DSM 22767]SCB92158.1 cysteinyl-tRNA synthetase [Bifidobacterium bohemicum]